MNPGEVDGLSSTGPDRAGIFDFSLWGLGIARTKTHRHCGADSPVCMPRAGVTRLP